MVKISLYRDMTIVTYIKIFLECSKKEKKKKGKLELFILAKFKWFLCKLFWMEKNENILSFKTILIEVDLWEALETQDSWKESSITWNLILIWLRNSWVNLKSRLRDQFIVCICCLPWQEYIVLHDIPISTAHHSSWGRGLPPIPSFAWQAGCSC